MARHKCGFGELERRALLSFYKIVKDIDRKMDDIDQKINYAIESRRNYYYSCKDEYQQE